MFVVGKEVNQVWGGVDSAELRGIAMNPPLKTKDVHHNQTHTEQKQKQKKTLHIPHPSIKQQIRIPHLIPLPLPLPLPLAQLKHILHLYITHQLIIYPHPPFSPLSISI